jgi:ABC-type transport system involved in multi-copper enzyme maturation permease subunit
MLRVFSAEWIKLRRPTLLLGTLLSVGGLVGMVTSFIFLLIDSPGGNGDRGQVITREMLALPSGLSLTFAQSAGLLGLAALCVFAAQTAQEYTYGTLRNILVRQPARMKVLAGKHLAMSLFALILVSFSAIIGLGLSILLAARVNVSTDEWFTSDAIWDTTNSLLNVMFATVAYGTIGMVLGLLLRSPISAISIGVIWILIVESLLVAVRSSFGKYLPGVQLSNIGQGGSIDLSYSYSMQYSLIFLALATTITAILFKRRDVAN